MATVLVVDDDATNRTYLRTLLVHRGHRVREAADGGTAVRLAENEPPDAVITDIIMPGDLDGYELARRLRSCPATRHVPIAFSTAHYDEHELESLARACGVRDVILKPARPAVVLATIDALLSGSADPAGPADPGAAPAPDGEPFVDEHRRALKSKLLQKSTALSRVEDRLRAVVESTRVGVVLADSDATATYVNPRLAEIAGLPRDALLGHGWLTWFDAADRERLHGVVTAGVPRGGRAYRVAARRVGMGPRWLDVRLHPTTESSAGDLVVVVEDVTETMRTRPGTAATGQLDAMRRHAAELADRLAETERVTVAGGWEFDRRTGLIVLSGRLADLLGLPAAMLSPRDLWRRAHPTDARRANAVVAGAMRTGRVRRFPLRLAGRGGVVRHFVVSCRPSTTDEPVWGVAHDVTGLEDVRIDAAVTADRRAERRVVDRFHRELLPDRMPGVRGARVAAAYRAVPGRLDSGGDWYDAVPAPRGGVVIAVGGVVAHGRHEVAVMGPARAALRAYAIEDPDPGRILARLNRFMAATFGETAHATAAVAHFDPDDGRLQVASAGHLAPLLVAPAGPHADPDVIPTGWPGPPLGLTRTPKYPVEELPMRPGAALCLYTDGLVDRRGMGVGTEIRALIGVLARAHREVGPGAPRDLVDRVLAGMLTGDPTDDDVCLAVLATTGS
jgi:PAS domain S-box-containing protein